MAKKTDPNDENLKRYQAKLKERGYDKLTPTEKELSIDELAAEGLKLLTDDQKKAPAAKVQCEQPKLDKALALSSKNPYVKARVQILIKWANNPNTAWRAKEIEQMECGKLPKNKHYDEFVKEVATLGDSFSL